MRARQGFTLIEILVASLLLGMLMTILTMVFNSSSIAWRTGKASVAKMSLARRQLAWAQYVSDNALPRVDTASSSDTGRILGAWDKDGHVRRRAVEVYDNWPFALPGWSSQGNVGSSSPQPWSQVSSIQSLQGNNGRAYLVGVSSRGPDGQPGTKDDITTMPMEVE